MKALEIPRGEVRPYGWIAAEIGKPRAVRAVGTALGHNPVPLIVPCHRVVRSDGMIGQYSMGGPSASGRSCAGRRRRTRGAGGAGAGRDRYSARTRPTSSASDLPRRQARHRSPSRPLSVLAAASAAGYRPCLHCRPATVASAA